MKQHLGALRRKKLNENLLKYNCVLSQNDKALICCGFFSNKPKYRDKDIITLHLSLFSFKDDHMDFQFKHCQMKNVRTGMLGLRFLYYVCLYTDYKEKK